MEDHVVCGAQPQSSPQVSLRRLFPKSKFFGGSDCLVGRIVSDPSRVKAGDLLAILPSCPDPTAAGCEALARGATAILTEQLLPVPLVQCIVPDAGRAAAKVSNTLCERPTDTLLMIGVVGMDGKTTTSLLMAAMLRRAGQRTAYETDLGASDGVVQTVPAHRSEGSLEILEFLAEARDTGSQAAVIELSDSLIRSAAFRHLQFDVLVLTGGSDRGSDDTLGGCVLDRALDQLRDGGVAIVNGDSRSAMAAADRACAPLLTYALRSDAAVTAKVFDQQPGQTTLMVTAGDTTAVMETPLTGPSMASSQLAAIALGLLLESPLHQSIGALAEIRFIPGRMQRISRFGQPSVVLDAAHNSRRLAAVLRSLRRERCGGRLWVVAAVDRGGQRSQGETADLSACGRVAERYADHVVVTAADDDKQDFLRLTHDWLDGVERAAGPRLIADREAAIRWVLDRASASDTVLIAGSHPSRSPAQERAELDAVTRLVSGIWDEMPASGPVLLPHPALLQVVDAEEATRENRGKKSR